MGSIDLCIRFFFSLSGGTGRRTGLKNTLQRVFNNIRDLSKTTENIVQTNDWRGFLADLRSESRVKRTKIHRRHIGDMKAAGPHERRTYNDPQWSCGAHVVRGGGK